MVARCCAVARRRRRAALILGAASIARLPPTNHRRRPPRGDRPLPHPAPHRRLAQVAHPAAGRSRMLIAVHGAARPPAAAATSASSFHEKEFREKETATAASRRRQRVGRIAGRSADRRRWVGAPLARARVRREFGLICPTKLLIVQCRVFGDDPVAEPRGAAGSRSRNISIIDVAVWRRVSCWSHAAARWPVVAGARR